MRTQSLSGFQTPGAQSLARRNPLRAAQNSTRDMGEFVAAVNEIRRITGACADAIKEVHRLICRGYTDVVDAARGL